MEGFVFTEAAKLVLVWLLLLCLSNLSLVWRINLSPKGSCWSVQHWACNSVSPQHWRGEAKEVSGQCTLWLFLVTGSKWCWCFSPWLLFPPEERQTARAHAADAQPGEGGQESWSNQPLKNVQASDSFHRLRKLHVQVPALYDGFPPEGDVGECLCALASLTTSVLSFDE